MSGEPATPGSRVLVIGQDPNVQSFVLHELGAAGVRARGSTLAQLDREPEAGLDLVAFGAGVPWSKRRALEARFRMANPAVRFVRTYAPYAASQIVGALAAARQPAAVDLAAYCQRIGHSDPLAPTLETLRALQARHLASIPFEAIDVLLGRGVDISHQAVEAKLIGARRGGYCYEQNGLFRRVLGAIGFEVDPLVASVRWMATPGEPPPPRTHMVLRVWIEGAPWLVDVGFGSAVPSAPLRIDTRDVQGTGDGRYRIIPLGAGFLVQAEAGDRWLPLYDFSSEPMLDEHYELFNWFTSTHPSSHFRRQLIVTRATPEARYALLEGRLTVRRSRGEVERSHLSPGEIAHALEDVFGLRPEPAWQPILEAAAESAHDP